RAHESRFLIAEGSWRASVAPSAASARKLIGNGRRTRRSLPAPARLPGGKTGLIDGRVIPGQPAAEAIESRKQYAFVHVGLVEFVANLPLQRCRDRHAPIQFGMCGEPQSEAENAETVSGRCLRGTVGRTAAR